MSWQDATVANEHDRTSGRAIHSGLAAYYEREAELGTRSELRGERRRYREQFVELLTEELRSRLVDVGSGPGLDTAGFAAAGFDVVGVDLAHANVVRMRDASVRGVCASLYEPPFADGSFEAVWTMSTLVHVPDDRFDEAMVAMVALAAPGAPVAIGSWGGYDLEQHSEFGPVGLPRFFSWRSHDRWIAMLERHAEVEHFETHHPNPGRDEQYQFAIVRRSGGGRSPGS